MQRRVTSVPCTVLPTAQARSRPTMPITMAPIGTSARFGRTRLSCAANSEPAAMRDREHGEADRHDAFGCRRRRLRPAAGSSDSTIAPTIQNQDTITMPSHRRGSGVERLQEANGGGQRIGCDRQIRRGWLAHGDTGRERPGQDRQPDHGQANPSHMRGASDKQTAGDRADQDRQEGRASTRALPVASSETDSWSGRISVFHRVRTVRLRCRTARAP